MKKIFDETPLLTLLPFANPCSKLTRPVPVLGEPPGLVTRPSSVAAATGLTLPQALPRKSLPGG